MFLAFYTVTLKFDFLIPTSETFICASKCINAVTLVKIRWYFSSVNNVQDSRTQGQTDGRTRNDASGHTTWGRSRHKNICQYSVVGPNHWLVSMACCLLRFVIVVQYKQKAVLTYSWQITNDNINQQELVVYDGYWRCLTMVSALTDVIVHVTQQPNVTPASDMSNVASTYYLIYLSQLL